MSLGLGPLTVFAFFQWTQKCISATIAFITAAGVFMTAASLAVVSFLILRLAFRPNGIEQLFSKKTTYGRRWGALYDVLHERKVVFILPDLLVVVGRSAVIGFGHSGVIQVGILIALELALCITLFIYKPFYSTGYNRVNYVLAGARAISQILHLPFIPQLEVTDATSKAIGLAILVTNSVVAFVIFVLTVLKLGWGKLWYRNKHVALESRKNLKISHQQMSSENTEDQF